MKIEKNKIVSLIYELREDNLDGKVIEALDDGRPLTFLFGSGRLLPEFESNISSLGKGDSFRFALDSGNAYGERREDMIIDLPVGIFEKEGKMDEEICQVGNEVPMVDSEGHKVTGLICEVGDRSVRMDFNHPMAGINLFFEGKILDVREATAEEIAGANYSCSSCGSYSDSGCSSGSCQG